MSNWQPAETAPKTGERILVHPACEVHDSCSKAFWSETWVKWLSNGVELGYEFTHWMPLPEAPT